VCDNSQGGTAFTPQGTIYVPCFDGLHALALQTGAEPRFTTLWSQPDFVAGPPIIAAGAVWTFDIYNGTLFAFNPTNGARVFSISLGSVGFVEHFTTPSVGGGLLLFAATETIYALNLSPSGTPVISVSTVNSAGTPLTGYYVSLWKNETIQLQSCFSPCSLPVSNGQKYLVAVADFGAETFSHWSDGKTSRFHTVDIGSNSTTTSLTAVYSP